MSERQQAQQTQKPTRKPRSPESIYMDKLIDGKLNLQDYDPKKRFIFPRCDKGGASKPVSFREPPELGLAVQDLITKKIYRNESEFRRDATVHRLSYFNILGAIALPEELSRWESERIKERVKANQTRLHELAGALKVLGAAGDPKALEAFVIQQRRHAEACEEPWRSRAHHVINRFAGKNVGMISASVPPLVGSAKPEDWLRTEDDIEEQAKLTAEEAEWCQSDGDFTQE